MRGSRIRPFLVVLKSFGARTSPGMLSFPMEGLTVAMDFPNLGERTRQMFDRLDEIVLSQGGRLYPAKDARMSADMFQKGYPMWKEFARNIDPGFSSEFWRRVAGGGHE
jgi:L-gulonolactone oxidase